MCLNIIPSFTYFFSPSPIPKDKYLPYIAAVLSGLLIVMQFRLGSVSDENDCWISNNRADSMFSKDVVQLRRLQHCHVTVVVSDVLFLLAIKIPQIYWYTQSILLYIHTVIVSQERECTRYTVTNFLSNQPSKEDHRNRTRSPTVAVNELPRPHRNLTSIKKARQESSE